jgi:DNA-binding HxlR family transcriptional regulator
MTIGHPLSREDVADTVCPIAYTISVVGDRWTLLILRELSMGVHRFDTIQAHTGISSHLLAERLRSLQSNGFLERRLYEEHPKRYEYHRTSKCKEFDPVLVMLIYLGRRWRGDIPKGEPAITLRLQSSGKVLNRPSQYPGLFETFTYDEAYTSIGPSFRLERDTRLTSFRKSRKPTQRIRKSVRNKGLAVNASSKTKPDTK